jgi:predicted MPP superfamily phosphohydrolase
VCVLVCLAGSVLHLSNGQCCIALVILSCISLLLSASTPIGGGDHDIVAFNIINLRNRLANNSIVELQSYALTLEKYNNNGKHILGGIHDYVHQMSKDDLIKFIVNVVHKKKELLDEGKFKSIVEGTQTVFLAVEAKPILGLGGLHDYIFRMDMDTLVRWAHTCQAHDNKITKKQNDLKVEEMTKEQLMSFILGMAKQYPGLDSSTELDRLSETYEVKTVSFGGLHDYLFRQSRSTLIRWALTGEAHERKVKNQQHLLGGLHDYIGTMSDVEIANYVSEKAKLYKELDSGLKLDGLAKQYSITYEELPRLTQFGGLHDYIFRKDRNTLINWALTCEFHDRSERKMVNVLGGLHDYIHTLSNEKIAEYILGMVAVYPVLNSADNLEAFQTKYEIKYTEEENKNISLKFLQ